MTVPVRTVPSTDTEGLADTLWRAWHENCPLAMATLEGAQILSRLLPAPAVVLSQHERSAHRSGNRHACQSGSHA